MSSIDWGIWTPDSLVGHNDPYTMTPLLPGQRVTYCTNCKLGYHPSTVAFLQTENRGACINCQMPNKWLTTLLPGAVVPASIVQPAVGPISTDSFVRLDKIWDHVGQVVTFEGWVHQVYQSAPGNWFVKFENTRRPVEGFRLVIYRRYAEAWAQAGLNLRDYEHRTIQVRGLIRDDPDWGIQMLIDQPGVISVVDDDKQSDTTMPDLPDEPEQPVQRIIWKTE